MNRFVDRLRNVAGPEMAGPLLAFLAVMLFFGRARAPKASEAEILPKTA